MSLRAPVLRLDRAVAALDDSGRGRVLELLRGIVGLAAGTDAIPEAVGAALADVVTPALLAYATGGADKVRRQLLSALSEAPTLAALARAVT